MTTRAVKQTVPLEEQQFRPGKPQLGKTPAPDNPTARSQKDSFYLFLDTKQQLWHLHSPVTAVQTANKNG